MARATNRARRHLLAIERRLDALERHICALEKLRSMLRRSFVRTEIAILQEG
jgi:hypothetical protein